jgi:RNA polymerase sigma factor (sigma-70 family)
MALCKSDFWRVVVSPFYAKVRGYFAGRVRPPDVADDLTQETFLKLLQTASIDGKANWPYVRRVARSVWADQVARDKARSSASNWNVGRVRGTLECEAEEWNRAAQAIQELPPGERDIVVLRLALGCTFREAGEILGLPHTTLFARHRRAVETLRKKLNRSKP